MVKVQILVMFFITLVAVVIAPSIAKILLFMVGCLKDWGLWGFFEFLGY